MSKSSKFHVVWTIRFSSHFAGMWDKHILRNGWSDFRLPMPALATITGKSFYCKIYCKNWFSDRISYITSAYADIGSLKSLHTLFGMYLDYILVKFDQNCMVRTVQNFDLFDKKWLTIFDKGLTPFWKTFLWLKIIWCLYINLKTISVLQCFTVFPKIRFSNTCNQVKSCTKHGRSNLS